MVDNSASRWVVFGKRAKNGTSRENSGKPIRYMVVKTPQERSRGDAVPRICVKVAVWAVRMREEAFGQAHGRGMGSQMDVDILLMLLLRERSTVIRQIGSRLAGKLQGFYRCIGRAPAMS